MSAWRGTIAQLRPELREQVRTKLAAQRAAARDSRPKRHLATIIPPAQSISVARLRLQLLADGVFGFREEFTFHPTRAWRFDFAHPGEKLAVEIEGLTYGGGRHQRMKGFTEDCRKYLAAMEFGWRVLRVTPLMVRSGEAIDAIKKLMTSNKGRDRAGQTADGDIRSEQHDRRGSAGPAET